MIDHNSDSDVTIHSVSGAEEREEILAVRTRLRADPQLRDHVLLRMAIVLQAEGLELSESARSHLTVALDVELNSEDGHVIT